MASTALAGFRKFHKDNPHVYGEFCRLARRMRKGRTKRYSAMGFIHVLRYRHALVTTGSKFKILNACAAFYSRMLAAEDPTFKAFFSFRPSVADGVDVKQFLPDQPEAARAA